MPSVNRPANSDPRAGAAICRGFQARRLPGTFEHSVQLSPAEEAELIDALDEADREEGVSSQVFFARLQRFG